jgi:Response regulators consisting of a CheY-like receiver domain and a winged-helix DNA-binding domain
MNKTVLVVEDDEGIANVVCKYLAHESFHFKVASTGPDALALFQNSRPDLVILDMMLPKMDGATVCEKIRALSDVPIIMVTALAEDVHRLDGFAKGADDYICKPFNPRELMARVKAVLRRTSANTGQQRTLSYGRIMMNLDERTVKIDDNDVVLTQTEFSLLEMFLANPSRAFTREELLEGSHMEYSESYLRSIDFHIKNLRRKINVDADSKFIKAVYGFGYKFY